MEDRDIRDTLHRLIRLCCEQADELPELSDSTEIEALQFDSLQLIQLVFEVELHYDIEVEEHRMLTLETLGDLQNLIRESSAVAV